MKNHQIFTNEVIQYDILTQSWNQLKIANSDAFLPRCSHTSIYIPTTNQIIILGGLGPKDINQNQLTQNSDEQQLTRYDLENIIILEVNNVEIKSKSNPLLINDLLSPLEQGANPLTKEIQLKWNTYDFPLDKDCKETIKDFSKNKIQESEPFFKEQEEF